MKRLLAALALAPMLAGLAHAETFTVTTLEDSDDGVCDADCSLREALDAANARPGPDVVELGPGVHRIAIRALEIEDDLELAGAGMDETALDPSDPFIGGLGVGRGRPEIRVVVRDLSLPGVENHAELVLERVRADRYGVSNSGRLEVDGSEVVDSGGGGIRNAVGAEATVRRTLVARNSATQTFGASGGGILNRGTMTVSESIIEGNRSFGGSGIANEQGGELTVVDSVIRGNYAGENVERLVYTGRGAGIANERDSSIRLERVTVADNVAGGLEGNFSSPPICGGIFNLGALVMVNVTVSGNSARAHLAYEGNRIGGGPGGLLNDGTLAMTNVTFSRNLSGDPPDTLRLAGEVTALNVLVDGECLVVEGDASEIVSLGGNLESPGDGCGFDDPSDLVGVPLPGLDGLDANGGLGGTHALLPFSPALDGGVSEGCPDTDQRGVPRADGACDIGAFEHDPAIDVPPPEEPPTPEPPPVEPPSPAPEPGPPSGGGGGGGGCAVAHGTASANAPVALLVALALARRRSRPG